MKNKRLADNSLTSKNIILPARMGHEFKEQPTDL